MKHVHHDMIVEWAADPSRVVQKCYGGGVWLDEGVWVDEKSPQWYPNDKYRFKPAEPKYIVVNGINVPEPVRGKLEDGQEFWLADVGDPARRFRWYASSEHSARWLSRGLVHLTREAAQAHIDAMLLPSRS